MGVRVETSTRAEVRQAVAACEEEIGPMPTVGDPFEDLPFDPELVARAGDMYLVIMERCLNQRGYEVRVEQSGGIAEIVSETRVTLDDLKSCSSAAIRAEVAIATQG
jgi:hypothetical protein